MQSKHAMGKFTLPSKSKTAAMLSLSFAVAFMLFFFAPLDTFLHNPHSFVVGWGFLLPQLVIFTMIGSAVIMAVLLMLMQDNILYVTSTVIILCIAPVMYARFVLSQLAPYYSHLIFFYTFITLICFLLIKVLKTKAVAAALFIMWGALIASYVQMLFLNAGIPNVLYIPLACVMPVLRLIINLAIWVAIMLLPMVICLLLRRKRTIKYCSAIVFTTVIVVGMQTAGLVSAAIDAELPAGFEDNPQYLSYAPLLELSPESNIVVFVLDFLDVLYMDEVLVKHPELFEQLDGFTYYTNNVSEYNGTFPQITQMLTQHSYSVGLSIEQYLEEAWSQRGLIDLLKENGYTTNLIIDRISTYNNSEQIQNRADNIRVADGISRTPISTSVYMGSISIDRLVPFVFKGLFLQDIEGTASRLYNINAADAPESVAVGMESDLFFYDYVRRSSMIADNDMKVFNFVHLNCAHPTNSLLFDAAANTILEGGDYIDSLRASFEMLNIYFQQMITVGVYDNSTIIILGDHGRRYGTHEDNLAVTTALLIKPQGERGRLEQNNDAELSHSNFAASVLESAGIYYEDYNNVGLSYFEIIESNISQVRYYNSYSWSWGGHVYEITGDANDYANWRLIE